MKTLLFTITILLLSVLLFKSNSNAQWVQTGPTGGSVKQVWNNSQYYYAMSSNGGLFRSTTPNGSFINITPLISSLQFQSFAGNGTNLICSPNYSDGLFRSTNNGDTWLPSNNGIPLSARAGYLVYGNSTFYCYCDSGLFKSLDNGISWTSVNRSIYIYYMTIIGNNLIARGSGPSLSGFMLSTNGGINWSNINNGFPQANNLNYRRAITSNSTSVFTIYGDTNSIGFGIFRTTNLGQNWYAVNSGLTDTRIYSLYAENNVIYAGTKTGIFKSIDNGNSWSAVNNGLLLTQCNTISGNGTSLIAGIGSEFFGGGLYFSTNGGSSWNSNNNGIYSQLVIDLTAKGNMLFSAINGSGIWRSVDNGNNWVKTNNGLPFTDTSRIRFIDYRALANDGQNIYCILNQSSYPIYKSSDDGNNWIYCSNGYHSSYIAYNNGKLYLGTSNGIYVSSNAGSNWNYLGLSNRSISGIDFSTSSIVACGSGVFQSTNNGVSWDTITENSPGGREIKVFNNNIFLVKYGSGGLYKRNIAGGNWVISNNGITNLGLEKIHSVNQYLLVTTHGDNDVFLSTDEGQNWINKNNGIKSWITSFASIGSNVFVGTYGQSTFKRPLSDIIGIQNISTEIPFGFILNQNYPNPFNPSTIINFSLPLKSFVKLKVYNILGKEIANLVNENLSIGTYEYEFNGENLTSGIYFYKLDTDKFSETKKMILIK